MTGHWSSIELEAVLVFVAEPWLAPRFDLAVQVELVEAVN